LRRLTMNTECTVSAIGIERVDCRRQDAERLKDFAGRLGVPIAALTLVLIAAVVATGLTSEAPVPDAQASAALGGTPGSAARGERFAFLDRELAYGGGYGLSLVGASRFSTGDVSDPVQYTSLTQGGLVGARRLSGSPLAGPEYWMAKARYGTAGALAEVRTDSPLAGPPFYVSRARLDTSEAVETVTGNSPLAGPEFYVARSRMGTSELVEGVGSDSPIAGPAFLVEDSTCAAWERALSRFHAAKRVADPANGASSASEAAFYVAQFGAGDAALLAAEGSVRDLVCEA
jgi:hypothetical protein